MLERLKDVVRTWVGPPPDEIAHQRTEPQLAGISLEYKYEDLRNGTDNFSQDRKLGSGAAGAVYRGSVSGGTEVAVKVLKDNGELAGFEDEVRMLSRFRHPNLVTLLGWGQHADEKYIVYELLPGGDVEKKLQKSKRGQQPFPWQQRLKVALDAACGLSYMINSEPKAFHRDIKPPNILLDANGNAKMADFGLAGTVRQDRGSGNHLTVMNISGTPGYACRDYIGSGKVSEKSEVYSYGTVLMEMLLNEPPALQGPDGRIIYPLMQVVQPAAPGAYERVMARMDPTASWPPSMSDSLAKLALKCVQHADHRPKFVDIVHEIRRLQEAAGPMPPQVVPGNSWETQSASGKSQGRGSQGQPQQHPQQAQRNPGWQSQAPPQPQMHGSGVYPGAPAQPAYGGGYPAGVQNAGPAAEAMPRRSIHRSNSTRSSGEGHDIAEIVLECIFAEGMDCTSLPRQHRAIALRINPGSSGSGAIGRQLQTEFFERLLPRPERLTVVSRAHFELSWDLSARSEVMLTKLSANPLLLNKCSLTTNEPVPVQDGARLGFAATPTDPPFLELNISLRSRVAVAHEGAHPAATSPAPRKGSTPSNAPAPTPAPTPGLPRPPNQKPAPAPPLKADECTQSRIVAVLECTKALGCELGTLSEEERLIRLQVDVPVEFGKQKQPGFFERLLESEPKWLSFISRVHCRMQLSASPALCLTVENRSTNVILIGGQKIPKDTIKTIGEGDELAFVAAPQPPEEIKFLIFALRRVHR